MKISLALHPILYIEIEVRTKGDTFYILFKCISCSTSETVTTYTIVSVAIYISSNRKLEPNPGSAVHKTVHNLSTAAFVYVCA